MNQLNRCAAQSAVALVPPCTHASALQPGLLWCVASWAKGFSANTASCFAHLQYMSFCCVLSTLPGRLCLCGASATVQVVPLCGCQCLKLSGQFDAGVVLYNSQQVPLL